MDPAIFPFDHVEFLQSLPQVGALLAPELPVLRRGGLPCGYGDAAGPLPYSQQLAQTNPAQLRNLLLRHELITFLSVLKPGAAPEAAAWTAAGFEVLPVSPHFVWQPDGPPLERSAKTRHNLRRAQEYWQVRRCDLTEHAAEMGTLYARLFAQREMSALLNYPPGHFAGLAAVPGIELLGAFDAEGLGAFLVYARHRQEIHTLHLVGAERAHRTRAAYALFQELWEREHAETTLYLGGAPRAASGAGIAKFKQRFTNTTLTPHLVRTILDPAACRRLQDQRGSHAWFPPYRSQHGD